MHLWKFFRVPDDIDKIPDYIDIRDKIPLFAVTTKKKYAKEFIKGRKKDRYLVKKSDVTQKEAKNFINHHRGQILEYFDLRTNHSGTERYVKVLMTEFELDNLTMLEESYGFLGSISIINPKVFSEKAWYIIERLDYTSAFYVSTDCEELINDSYPYLDWYCDQLGLFLYVNDTDINHKTFIDTIKFLQ